MTQTKSPLNQGQQAAADGFFNFLFSDQKELIISGPGGVGKTFLMGHLIDEIMPQYEESCRLVGTDPIYTDVVMTATTNKAAEVLGRATGRPSQTTHSFFNLKVVDDYTTGRSNIVKTQSWKVHSNCIIFIDECSMIDRQLLLHIREGTVNCKIVYVGDHCQSAPVHEPLSPIYNQGLPFFELTEPMRTNDPHLQALNLQLRQTVESGLFLPIQLVPGVITYLTGDEMEQLVDTMFANGPGENRILAYTNQRVTDYNNHIRSIRQIQETYVQGETLINNSAVQLSKGMLSVEAEITIDRLDPQTHLVEIVPEVELECVGADISTSYGERYYNVNLPVDKEHYVQLCNYFRKAKNWSKFYKLKNTYPDLRPRDAATVHKSQGSSHDFVFVDLENISTCHNPNQAARMLYVAMSRARNGIYVYGDLAKKYGGLLQP
jgi:hypothetical protein